MHPLHRLNFQNPCHWRIFNLYFPSLLATVPVYPTVWVVYTHRKLYDFLSWVALMTLWGVCNLSNNNLFIPHFIIPTSFIGVLLITFSNFHLFTHLTLRVIVEPVNNHTQHGIITYTSQRKLFLLCYQVHFGSCRYFLSTLVKDEPICAACTLHFLYGENVWNCFSWGPGQFSIWSFVIYLPHFNCSLFTCGIALHRITVFIVDRTSCDLCRFRWSSKCDFHQSFHGSPIFIFHIFLFWIRVTVPGF